MVRITHLRKNCIGCNYCVEVAPDRWRMDETDGKSTLIGAKEKKGNYTLVVTDDEYDANKEAAAICPVNIIKIEQFF